MSQIYYINEALDHQHSVIGMRTLGFSGIVLSDAVKSCFFSQV